MLTVRGGAMTFLSQGVLIATQLISVVVLSRMLTPYDFGILGMAMPVITLAGLLQNMGITQAIVQIPNITHRQLSSLFWMGQALHLLLALSLCACAPLIAQFYNAPEITYFLMAYAGMIYIHGLTSQPHVLLQRRMEFGVIAAVTIVNAILILGFSIWGAYLFQSYWAFAAGGFAGAFWNLILFWVLAKYKPSFTLSFTDIKTVLGFGGGVTGAQICTLLERSLDNILIGRSWGANDLGFYERAFKLLVFPIRQILMPLNQVIVPALSRLQEDLPRYQAAFWKAQSQLYMLLFPFLIFLSFAAMPFITFVLGEGWAQTGEIFLALIPAAYFLVLCAPLRWMYLTHGRGKTILGASFLSAGFTCTAIIIGLPYGVIGVALAVSLAEISKSPFLFYIAARANIVPTTLLLKPLPVFIGGGLLSAFACYVGGLALQNLPVFFYLLGLGCISYAFFIAGLLIFPQGRACLKQTYTGLKGLVPQR